MWDRAADQSGRATQLASSRLICCYSSGRSHPVQRAEAIGLQRLIGRFHSDMVASMQRTPSHLIGSADHGTAFPALHIVLWAERILGTSRALAARAVRSATQPKRPGRSSG